MKAMQRCARGARVRCACGARAARVRCACVACTRLRSGEQRRPPHQDHTRHGGAGAALGVVDLHTRWTRCASAVQVRCTRGAYTVCVRCTSDAHAVRCTHGARAVRTRYCAHRVPRVADAEVEHEPQEHGVVEVPLAQPARARFVERRRGEGPQRRHHQHLGGRRPGRRRQGWGQAKG